MNKQENIINMFDRIATSYDIANRILSLSVDVRWRKEACKCALSLLNEKVKDSTNAKIHKDSTIESNDFSTTNSLDSKDNALNILDVACGTGDMILHWLKYVPNIASISGIDPSVKMLEIAKDKLPKNVTLLKGEAKNLSINSDSMDIISIAYGLRNVVELDLALKEFRRVLKSGGILVILEFSRKDKQTLLDKGALFYTKRILPLVGGLISKDYGAYKYLPNSIESFLSLEELREKLEALGLKCEFSKRYIANLCSLIIARKI